MIKTDKWIVLIILAVMGSLGMSACGTSKSEATPTIDVNAVQTSVISTFAAGVTQTAFSLPTNTPTSTPTSTPTAMATITPGRTSSGPLPTVVSCYGLVLVADVTIPDKTAMAPGQAFTKTWRVKNSGTCAWDAGFKFIFTGGDAMGGTTQVLSQSVAPGSQIDISIPMTAPTKTGTVTGYWKMSTTSGSFFNNDVFVMIIVGAAGPTSTGTPPTATGTPPTATPTGLTATPQASFNVAYVSVADCGSDAWRIIFEITNTGNVTWESNRVIATDQATSETITIDRNNFPEYAEAGCGVLSESINLEAGEVGYTASNNFSADASGHALTATIRVCSQDGMLGTCVEKTITFTP
jgi:hypothetical protein